MATQVPTVTCARCGQSIYKVYAVRAALIQRFVDHKPWGKPEYMWDKAGNEWVHRSLKRCEGKAP